jgi:hypothetical protein
MPLILGANSVTGGYEVDNSLRFDDGSSDSLTRTPSSNGDQKIWTFSGWVKRGNLSSYQYLLSAYYGGSDRYTTINFEDDDKLLIYGGVYTTGASTTVSFNKKTSQVFRDVSAWYHIVVAVDTTQATASDRIKIYVNGSQITSFATNTDPSQNDDTFFNVTTTGNQVGAVNSGSYYDGYMSECVFIDGQQLDPTSFGEFDEDTGIWKPIAISGLTYGTNGFFLKISKIVQHLGDDSSGNGNDFTVNNLTSIDQTTDTPSNVFSTMSPLIPQNPSSTWTFSDGNTTTTSVNTVSIALSTLGFSKGKWYWEVKVGAEVPAGLMVGIAKEGININSAFLGEDAFGYAYFVTGNKYNNGNQGAYGDAMTNGDIISVAYDADNGTIWFARNGTWQNSATQIEIENGTTTNSAFSGLDTTATYFFSLGNGGSTYTNYANFGNPPFAITTGNEDADGFGNFEYDVPSGYFALCSKNLAEYG